jgi:hypothetical protein
MLSGAVATLHGFLPWDTAGGVPRGARATVRVGPDGAWQLWTTADGMAHLRSADVTLDVAVPATVRDAVLHPEGRATILADADSPLVLQVDADGSVRHDVDLTRICAAVGRRLAGNTTRRLLTDAGHTYVTDTLVQDGILLGLDDGAGQVVTTWRSGYPAIDCRAGTVTFPRYTGSAARYFTLVGHDLASGAETTRDTGRDGRELVTNAVGLDGAGRLYGHAHLAYVGGDGSMPTFGHAPLLGREDATGHVDWLVRLDGVAVDGPEITLLLRDDDGTGHLLRPDGSRVPVEDTPATRGARLAGHDDAGGHLLHRHDTDRYGTRRGHGTLLRLDPAGHLTNTEPAGDHVYRTTTTVPTSSPAPVVTPSGEILLPVSDSAGVHVVGVGPPR